MFLLALIQAAAPILPAIPVTPDGALMGGIGGFAIWLWREDRKQYQELAKSGWVIAEKNTESVTKLNSSIEALRETINSLK